MIKISVLISIYNGNTGIEIDNALLSIWDKQIVKPDEIVIIVDGYVNDSIIKICNKWLTKLNNKVVLHENSQNIGLTKSLNIGINLCKYDYIARMDADDISLPNRFKLQKKYLESDSSIDLIGGYIREVNFSLNKSFGIRKVSTDPRKLRSAMMVRNDINHVSVIFRKDLIVKLGGYPESLKNCQDYYLWLLMLKNKCKIVNLPHVLVDVNFSDSYLKRRGIKFLFSELKVIKFKIKNFNISAYQIIKMILIRCVARLAPFHIKRLIYKLDRKTAS